MAKYLSIIAFPDSIRYSSMMILVFGKHGQVARALATYLPDAIFLSSEQTPFTDTQKILTTLDQHNPSCVINAAAYTAVDKAESEKELSLQINAEAPGVIANWCKKKAATLIHFSTDYVFDGSGEKPWLETDMPNPINWYGHTKREGEKKIQESGCTYYIFRISWVYSDWGHNFANTIRRLACERKELKIVNDQWGAPTHALDVGKTVAELVQKILNQQMRQKPGLYHLCYSPFMSWYDFALKIIAEARQKGLPIITEKVIPISTEEYPTPARRPKNSRLSSGYLHDGRC